MHEEDRTHDQLLEELQAAKASGGDALVLEERHEGAIDLLLTDVIMPQMNGQPLTGREACRPPEHSAALTIPLNF